MDAARKNYLVNKYFNQWQWCPLCRCPKIVFNCCQKSSCSGVGCDSCTITSLEIEEMFIHHWIPSRDEFEDAEEKEQALARILEVESLKAIHDALISGIGEPNDNLDIRVVPEDI